MSEREEMIARLIHDLRAPLARARTLVKLLQAGEPLDKYLPTLAETLAEMDQEFQQAAKDKEKK